MAADKSRNGESAQVEVARYTSEGEHAETPAEETPHGKAHRTGVEAVARALDQGV